MGKRTQFNDGAEFIYNYVFYLLKHCSHLYSYNLVCRMCLYLIHNVDINV